MSERLEVEIAALPTMSLAELQTRWRKAFKGDPPLHIRKPLMVPLLAYKLQEKTYGGLKPHIRRRLEKLALEFERNPKKAAKKGAAVGQIKAGTRFIREWNGATHQVTAGEKDFLYDGKSYKSLSVIARHITGTRWSGPLFFGLKGKQS